MGKVAPKMEGGKRFRELETFNSALLANKGGESNKSQALGSVECIKRNTSWKIPLRKHSWVADHLTCGEALLQPMILSRRALGGLLEMGNECIYGMIDGSHHRNPLKWLAQGVFTLSWRGSRASSI